MKNAQLARDNYTRQARLGTGPYLTASLLEVPTSSVCCIGQGVRDAEALAGDVCIEIVFTGFGLHTATNRTSAHDQ